MDSTIRNIQEEIRRRRQNTDIEDSMNLTFMAVREHGQPYSFENSGMGGSDRKTNNSMNGTLMAVREHGQPYKGWGMSGLMVPSNPDIFKTKMAVPEHGQPFFQKDTIVRPDSLEHEPYMNNIENAILIFISLSVS